MKDKRLVGIELEISDINTYAAVELLYNYFDLDIKLWENLLGFPDKLKVSYDQWNAVFDSTIKNSDGSICMFTYINNGNQQGIKKINLKESSLLSKGVEIISPPTNDYQELAVTINDLVNIMLQNGAKISKKLNNALHVHVDARDVSFEQIAKVPEKIYNIQKSLEKLLVPDTIPKVYSYTDDDLYRFSLASSKEELYSEYMIVNGHPDHPLYSARRIINIKPWFVNSIENKTFEFRCFSATDNTEYIREAINLSLSIMDYLLYDISLPFDLESKTLYMNSICTDSTVYA